MELNCDLFTISRKKFKKPKKPKFHTFQVFKGFQKPKNLGFFRSHFSSPAKAAKYLLWSSVSGGHLVQVLGDGVGALAPKKFFAVPQIWGTHCLLELNVGSAYDTVYGTMLKPVSNMSYNCIFC